MKENSNIINKTGLKIFYTLFILLLSISVKAESVTKEELKSIFDSFAVSEINFPNSYSYYSENLEERECSIIDRISDIRIKIDNELINRNLEYDGEYLIYFTPDDDYKGVTFRYRDDEETVSSFHTVINYNAKTIEEEPTTEDHQELTFDMILNSIKDTYNSNYSEIELPNNDELYNEIENQIKEDIKNNNIDLANSDYDINIYFNFEAIHNWTLEVYNSNNEYKERNFNVVFANSNNSNTEDEEIINNSTKDIYTITNYTSLNKEEIEQTVNKTFNTENIETEIKNEINNPDIQIIFDGIGADQNLLSGGLFGYTFLFVNDVWYKTAETYSLYKTKFILPSEITDTDTFILYKVSKYLEDNNDILQNKDLIILDGNTVYTKDEEIYLGEFIYEKEPAQSQEKNTVTPTNTTNNNSNNTSVNQTKKTTTKKNNTTTKKNNNTGTGKTETIIEEEPKEEEKNELTYEITSGTNQIYTLNKSDNILYKLDADLNAFNESGIVYIDEVLVEKENYQINNETNSITINKDYLEKLELGSHRIRFVFNSEKSAETTFIIREQPKVEEKKEEDKKEEEKETKGESKTLYVVAAVAAGLLLIGAGIYIFIKGRY